MRRYRETASQVVLVVRVTPFAASTSSGRLSGAPHADGPRGVCAAYWYGSKGMPAYLASARWEEKAPSFRPKWALPKSAWLSFSRSVAG